MNSGVDVTEQGLTNLFRSFARRDNDLQRINRYAIRPVMYYRPDLYIHSRHVGWLLDALSPAISAAFADTINLDQLILMGLVHDDLEIIMGDVQAAHKVKMNEKQKADLASTEKRAIHEVSDRFPDTLGGYIYQELLTTGNDKTHLYGQLVKYADWLDAYGESMHEVLGGNTSFTQQTTDQYGTHPTPVDFYVPRLQSFTKHFPLTTALFNQDHPLLQIPEPIDVATEVVRHQPHTARRIHQSTNFALYDAWKEVIRTYADTTTLEKLFIRQE